MRGLGSGENGEWEFLDIITLISFCIALQNLEENFTQSDLQDVAAEANKKQSDMIDDIHKHLADQDKKIDNILAILKENGGIIYDS